MSKRDLLLCFDAFGTLFRPRAPIEKQYAEIARQCGLSGLKEDQIRSSFASAFRAEAKKHPNYGKHTALGPTQWWTNVIHRTFEPLVTPAGTGLPSDLAPRLLARFASGEGYAMAPHLPALLRSLRQPLDTCPDRVYDRIVIGVITNSDDRVPDILASFGLQVSPLRYSDGSGNLETHASVGDAHDISFHCMSYDVGCEKPDPRIFRAAEGLLIRMLLVSDMAPDVPAPLTGSWDKMYVGDDFEKDVIGARDAGWYSIYLCGQEDEHAAIPDLERFPAQPLSTLFGQHHHVFKTRDLAALSSWLLGHPVSH